MHNGINNNRLTIDCQSGIAIDFVRSKKAGRYTLRELKKRWVV